VIHLTAKEYLQQIRDLTNAIKNKESELFLLECLATGTTAGGETVKIKGKMHCVERVQTSGTSDKVGDLAVKIVMMQNEILMQKAEALEKISECISVIEKIKELPCNTAETQYNILHKRYVEFKKLNQIAEEECYNYDYIRELHGVALQNVKKIMPEQKEPTQTHIL
jgi:hypothetical protein